RDGADGRVAADEHGGERAVEIVVSARRIGERPAVAWTRADTDADDRCLIELHRAAENPAVRSGHFVRADFVCVADALNFVATQAARVRGEGDAIVLEIEREVTGGSNPWQECECADRGDET